MGRVLARAFAIVGWALLAASALAGVAVAALVAFALSPFGGPIVAEQAIRLVDDAVQGSLALEKAEILPHGGIAIRGLVVRAPDGQEVLRVPLARVLFDVRHVRAHVVGLAIDLEDPFVDLAREDDGSLSLANAFAPTHPSPEKASQPSSWTVRITRLALSGGEVRASGLDAVPDLLVRDVAITARGAWGQGGGAAELALRGRVEVPMEAPLSLDADVSLEQGRIRASTLALALGDNALELVGEADLAAKTGRVAVLRLGVARSALAAMVPAAKALGGNLSGELYAEADGAIATAALALAPPAGATRGGRADAVAAVRLPPATFAGGFQVVTEALDPSRLVGAAPEGAVSLRAHGAVAGDSVEALRGAVDVRVAPSRIGRGAFGPVTLAARADRGSYDVSRLDARLPGLALSGGGRWRKGGAVSGSFDADASDLARALRTITAATGVALPELAGRGKATVRLAGTASRPTVDAHVDAPVLRTGGLAVEGVRVRATTSGPLRSPDVAVDGTVATLRTGGAVRMRGARVHASLAPGGDAAVDVTAAVPGVGTEPLSVRGRGRLGRARDRLDLSELVLAWPKARFALVAPAEVRFAGPSVDRLELASGPQRIAVAGGLGRRGRVDVRAAVVELDLARLPPGLVPADLGLAGALTLEANVTGTTARPKVAARIALAGGAVVGVSGLDALGEAGWDGVRRRATVDVEVRRDAGGILTVRGEVPGALGNARASEPISLTVHAERIDVAAALRAAHVAAPAAGVVGLDAKLGGTIGDPVLEATASLEAGTWKTLAPIAAQLELAAPGDEARLTLRAQLENAGTAVVTGAVPLDLGALLARPGPTLKRLRGAAAAVHAEVPTLDLAALAGRSGVPAGVAGRLSAVADVKGTVDAPRGIVRAQLVGGAIEGYTDLGVTAQATLGSDRIALEALGALGREALLQLDAQLGAPLERISSAEGLRRAPVRIDATIPRVALDRAARVAVPVAGTVEGRLRVTGTLAAPVAELSVRGDRVALDGKLLGAVTASARYANGHGALDADVAPAAGGHLKAAVGVDAALGLDADWAKLSEAPATARVTAAAVDLRILAALVPRTIRRAEGRLDASLAGQGPLARLRPRGTVRVTKGKIAVAEYGDWHDVAAEADLGDDDVVLKRFVASRRGGKLELTGAIRGLRQDTATIEAHARLDKLTVVYAGQDAATIDLAAAAKGSLRGSDLRARVELERGLVRIPNRTPRPLQSIQDRPDIVVGRPRAKRAAEAEPEKAPFHAVVDVVIPARLQVVCDDPKYDITLRGDTQFELEGTDVFTEGAIEVVRGEVEPLGGRLFTIERGRIQFTGGPPRAAVVDAAAVWKHPSAVVTVTVSGPVFEPTIRLSSQPPMDDAQIATLIATGRAELKPGAAGAGTLTASQAGEAAASAIANKLLGDVLLKKLPLPVDTVALDTGGVRAGTYLNDRVYVGYTRRFEAQETHNENRDEFRVEYQITPRWTLEGEVGDKRSSASLIWSKNY